MTTQNHNGRTPRDAYARDEHGRGARGRRSRPSTREDEPGDEAYRESSGRYARGADEGGPPIDRLGGSPTPRDRRETHWIDRPYRAERSVRGDRELDRDREASVEHTGYRRELRPIGAVRPGPHRGKGPLGYQRSDERIRELVCEALADDDQVDATQIEVTVSDGIVTLSGAVPDRPTKRMAEDCVDRVWGVRDVHNQLEIVLGARGNRPGSGSVGGTEL